jgi:hypothetical protein
VPFHGTDHFGLASSLIEGRDTFTVATIVHSKGGKASSRKQTVPTGNSNLSRTRNYHLEKVTNVRNMLHDTFLWFESQ